MNTRKLKQLLTLKMRGFVELTYALADFWQVIWSIEAAQGKELPNTLKNGDAWLTSCDSLGHMGALREHKALDGMNALMTVSIFDCECCLAWDMAAGLQGAFCADHQNMFPDKDGQEPELAHFRLLMETDHAEYCQDNNMFVVKHNSVIDKLITDKKAKENETFNRLTKDIKLD